MCKNKNIQGIIKNYYYEQIYSGSNKKNRADFNYQNDPFAILPNFQASAMLTQVRGL